MPFILKDYIRAFPLQKVSGLLTVWCFFLGQQCLGWNRGWHSWGNVCLPVIITYVVILLIPAAYKSWSGLWMQCIMHSKMFNLV